MPSAWRRQLPFNGSGTYAAISLPGSWNPAVDGSPATPTDWNLLLLDLSTALSTTITRDGQSTVTADIDFNTHKLKRVAPATLNTDAPNVLQIQRDSLVYCADNSASGAAIVLVASPAITSNVAGTRLSWVAAFANTDSPTFSINGISVTLSWPDGGTIAAGTIPAGAAVTAIFAATAYHLQTVSAAPAFWQQNVQETFASATGTTLIPWDNSIPQIAEGDEYMTVGLTPKRTGNKIIIRVVFNYAYSISDQITVALFRDATTNAIAAASNWASAGGDPQQIVFQHITSAASLSATTFRVRAGGNSAGTLTFNGAAGAQKLGGVNASSISVEEVSP